MKKIPTRKCLATNQIFPKSEMFRVVRTPSNEVVLDITGKINGRGAYISKSFEAIEKAKKSKCLSKALETEIPEEVGDNTNIDDETESEVTEDIVENTDITDNDIEE